MTLSTFEDVTWLAGRPSCCPASRVLLELASPAKPVSNRVGWRPGTGPDGQDRTEIEGEPTYQDTRCRRRAWELKPGAWCWAPIGGHDRGHPRRPPGHRDRVRHEPAAACGSQRRSRSRVRVAVRCCRHRSRPTPTAIPPTGRALGAARQAQLQIEARSPPAGCKSAAAGQGGSHRAIRRAGGPGGACRRTARRHPARTGERRTGRLGAARHRA
jgi:hypothetical protein